MKSGSLNACISIEINVHPKYYDLNDGWNVLILGYVLESLESDGYNTFNRKFSSIL